jgi:hypothetical protein
MQTMGQHSSRRKYTVVLLLSVQPCVEHPRKPTARANPELTPSDMFIAVLFLATPNDSAETLHVILSTR